MMTAAASTGPASGPRPTSSTPAMYSIPCAQKPCSSCNSFLRRHVSARLRPPLVFGLVRFRGEDASATPPRSRRRYRSVESYDAVAREAKGPSTLHLPPKVGSPTSLGGGWRVEGPFGLLHGNNLTACVP